MNVCKRMYVDFARLCTGRQGDFYRWVCENGKEFKGRTLTKAECAWLQGKISKKIFTLGQCVHHSQMGAIDGELRYFEGQANTQDLGVPLEHAWLVDKEGKVWDATWKDGEDYFGVEIPTDFVRKNILLTGNAEFLLAKYYSTRVEASGLVVPVHGTNRPEGEVG